MDRKTEPKLVIKAATVIVFAAFIFVLSVLNLFTRNGDFSENENRVLAPPPQLSAQNIFFGSFDTEFETWFSDQFIARDFWISVNAGTVKAAGKIENNGVYFAGGSRLIQQFLSQDGITADNNAEIINEFAQENGIRVNVMLVPGASYGERKYLPLGASNVDEAELIDHLYEVMSEQNCVRLTDMISGSEDYYFRTDHHWNEKGARIGYEAICRDVLHTTPEAFSFIEASSDFRGTMYSKSGAFWTKGEPIFTIAAENPAEVTVTYEDGTVTHSLYNDKNLAIKDQYTYYLDGNHPYVRIQTTAESGRKAVIIKDSFAHILIPYLAEEYSEIEMFDLRYYRDPVSEHITDPANTDVYVIYSVETFCSDTNLAVLW